MTSRPSLAPLSDGAIGHLYRGELARADGWRTRLDTTVNWSISVSAAVITFSFSSPGAAPIPILAGIWLVGIFLVVETRRYRYYDFWYRRLRLIEDGLWAPLLRRELVDVDALRELAVDMERPQLQVSFLSALMVRIRRVYGALLVLLLVVYVVKLDLHPWPAKSLAQFTARATIGPVPGAYVVTVLSLLGILVVVLYALSFLASAPQGELRTRPRTRRMRFWETMSRPYGRRGVRSARRARVGLH
jgi:uncharacterized membrane protein